MSFVCGLNFHCKAKYTFSSFGIGIKSVSTVTAKTNFDQCYYPEAPHPNQDDIIKLNEFITNCKNLLILSGAGLSTESGIPDYRSKDVGLYDRTNHKPMTHQEFISSFQGRQRYWARNYLGWENFQNRRPNKGHIKLSQLEKLGKAHWHVTQNVDGLQTLATSKCVTELHGCMHRVVCLDCKEIFDRSQLQKQFQLLNRDWSANVSGFGPDADVFVKNKDVLDFEVPTCKKCGGVLKPDVIFFGDSVPLPTVEFVNDKVDKSDGMLVVGSSLHVWSGYKFVLRAFNNSIPIAAINVGPTRADKLFSLKLNALCTKVLSPVEVS